jgi:V-type H+-transporting ATPase subunit a
MELNELKHVINFADSFLKDTSGGETSVTVDTTPLEQEQGSMRFNTIAGVIHTPKLVSFERILWRISKGNVFLKTTDIEEELEDPSSGESLQKSLFIMFFQVIINFKCPD